MLKHVYQYDHEIEKDPAFSMSSTRKDYTGTNYRETLLEIFSQDKETERIKNEQCEINP